MTYNIIRNHSLRSKAITTIIVMLFLASTLTMAFNIQTVKAEPLELYYDDGTPDGGLASSIANQTVGKCIKFDHPQIGTSLRILSAKIYIYSDGGFPLRLFVYVYEPSAPDPSKPYRKRYEDITSVLTGGWNTIDLNPYFIITEQDFFIGVTWVVPDMPKIGFDTSAECHFWEFDTMPWTDIYNHRDGMILMFRAEVEFFVPMVGGIWVPVDKFALLAPYIALASTILAATATTAIYVKHVKRRKEKQ